MDDINLAHSRYNCTHYIVFNSEIPEESNVWSTFRREVVEILGKVCRMEEVTIIKAAVLPDHVHMMYQSHRRRVYRMWWEGSKGRAHL